MKQTKACKPSSVIAGFKKTGICPLDPNAIKIIPAFGEVSHLQGGNGQQDPLKSTSSHQTDLENSSMDTLSSSNDCLSSQLSKEQLKLFERRYENGMMSMKRKTMLHGCKFITLLVYLMI